MHIPKGLPLSLVPAGPSLDWQSPLKRPVSPSRADHRKLCDGGSYISHQTVLWVGMSDMPLACLESLEALGGPPKHLTQPTGPGALAWPSLSLALLHWYLDRLWHCSLCTPRHAPLPLSALLLLPLA